MSSLMFLRTDWTQACADDTGNCLRTFAVPSQVCLIGASCWLDTRGRRRVTQRFPTRIIRDSPALFAFPTLSRVRFVTPLHHFCMMQFFSRKNKKIVQFFFQFSSVYTPWQGGQWEHTVSGKVDCVCACEDRASSPTLTVFVNFQTLSTIINRPSSVNSWLIATMVLSTVGW